MLTFTTLAAVVLTGISAPAKSIPKYTEFGPARSSIILVDAHSYRHCHNIHTRVYCHKRDRLPMNWPPLSDTPHQGGWIVRRALDCPVTVIRRSFRSNVTLTCPVRPASK